MEKGRLKLKLTFFHVSVAVFYYFAANSHKNRIEAQILLVKKQKLSTEIKTIKI